MSKKFVFKEWYMCEPKWFQTLIISLSKKYEHCTIIITERHTIDGTMIRKLLCVHNLYQAMLLLTCQRHRSCQWQKLLAVRWAFYRLTIHDIQAVQTYYKPSLIVVFVKQSATEGNVYAKTAVSAIFYCYIREIGFFINLWIFVFVFSVNFLFSTVRVVYLFLYQ